MGQAVSAQSISFHQKKRENKQTKNPLKHTGHLNNSTPNSDNSIRRLRAQIGLFTGTVSGIPCHLWYPPPSR